MITKPVCRSLNSMKVLITEDLHPYLSTRLTQWGCQCVIEPAITNQEVADCLHEYEGLVVATKIKVTAELLDRAPELKWVARAGSGMENIDLKAAAERNVACVNSPEGNCDAVAEQVLGMLLAMFNNTVRSDAEMRRGIWLREANRGIELGGKTVGIVGFGHTGSSVARKLQGFNVRILAYDKYLSESPVEYAELASMDRIAEEADVLSLHLPLTPETAHFFNSELIQRFRKPFWLVNTSRGSVLKTEDLLAGLADEKVLGAALDVFENEKPHTYNKEEQAWWAALRRHDRVLLSPHVAGWTVESKHRIAEVLCSRIQPHLSAESGS